MLKYLLWGAMFPLASALFKAGDPTTVTLNNGVVMPRISLGTCCGSLPSVGLPSWLSAGGVGIDTAYDYMDQYQIKKILESVKRDSVFITTKIPAGLGRKQDDCGTDPNVALQYVKEDIQELGVKQVDLVLLHAPCDFSKHHKVENATASDNALWAGLKMALDQGLTRAIGVSNYDHTHLAALSGDVPSVNQCQLSIAGSFGQKGHDDATIKYCQDHGIVYESYGALKGCPFSDSHLGAIADQHNKSVAQVCLRWTLQRGAVVAAGTGANATSAAAYAKENLDIFSFELDSAEMEYLNNYGVDA